MEKKLPAAAEVAIAAALREVLEAGADPLVIAAVAQQIEIGLDRKGFALRPGFNFVARNVVDLGGKDKLAELKAKQLA